MFRQTQHMGKMPFSKVKKVLGTSCYRDDGFFLSLHPHFGTYADLPPAKKLSSHTG